MNKVSNSSNKMRNYVAVIQLILGVYYFLCMPNLVESSPLNSKDVAAGIVSILFSLYAMWLQIFHRTFFGCGVYHTLTGTFLYLREHKLSTQSNKLGLGLCKGFADQRVSQKAFTIVFYERIEKAHYYCVLVVVSFEERVGRH